MESKKMTGKVIARKLVIGAQATDHMRKDIDFLLSSIIGILVKKGVFGFNHTFSSSDCKWQVSIKKHIDLPITRRIECYIKIDQDWKQVYSTSSGLDAVHTDLKYVQQVHANLPVLIDGMRKAFPFLEDAWQPILDNADYAKRLGW